jgi:hypothetical protein
MRKLLLRAAVLSLIYTAYVSYPPSDFCVPNVGYSHLLEFADDHRPQGIVPHYADLLFLPQAAGSLFGMVLVKGLSHGTATHFWVLLGMWFGSLPVSFGEVFALRGIVRTVWRLLEFAGRRGIANAGE